MGLGHSGAPGGVPDLHLQDRAATAAAGGTYSLKGWRTPRPGTFWANLAASSWRLWWSSWSLSLHSQLRGSSCEDSQQGIEHFNSGGFHCLSLEAMGCSLQLCGQQGGAPSPSEHMLRGSRQQFTSSETVYNKIIECIHLPLE